jgi:hypothetical protein
MTMPEAQQTEGFKKALCEIEDSPLGPPVTESLKNRVSPPTWPAIATYPGGEVVSADRL